MARAICPACQEEMRISDRVKVGQTLDCYHCAERLIIIRLNPLELEGSDVGEWEDERVGQRQAGSRNRNQRSWDWDDGLGFDVSDRYEEDDDHTRRNRRNRNKKSRDRRDSRRRHQRRDSLYDDF